MTDDDIWFHLGKNILDFKKHYGIDTAQRSQVVGWAKANLAPIATTKEEIISREHWDLAALRGATIKQMTHEHITQARQYIYDNYQPRHTTALLMLCANRKPYHLNQNILHGIRNSKGVADLIIVSNPGMIPIEYDNLYPFRYYEWDEREETEEIQATYTTLVTQWIGDFFKRFPYYTKVVSFIRPGQTRDAFLAADMPQQKVDVFEQSFIDSMWEKFSYCGKGIFKQRLLCFKESQARVAELVGKKGLLQANLFNF